MTKRNVDAVLIEALALGSSQREAAKRAGVSERTVGRRMRDREFTMALEHRQGHLRAQVEAQLIASSELAADVLIDVMQNGPPGARVRAAVAVLDRVDLPTGPPTPAVPQGHDDAVDLLRRRLDKMAENMKANEKFARNQTKPDKTGQN